MDPNKKISPEREVAETTEAQLPAAGDFNEAQQPAELKDLTQEQPSFGAGEQEKAAAGDEGLASDEASAGIAVDTPTENLQQIDQQRAQHIENLSELLNKHEDDSLLSEAQALQEQAIHAQDPENIEIQ